MTPLKPIENTQNVKAAYAREYPLNVVCSVPGCDRTDLSKHHIFGRMRGPDKDSWFVQLVDPIVIFENGPDWKVPHGSGPIIPQITNLCGHGTEGHHGDVEAHRAWIRLEEDKFIWCISVDANEIPELKSSGWFEAYGSWWHRIGPLDPQPMEPKQKRTKPKGEAKPQKSFSVKLPFNEDNLPEEVPRKFERLREILEDPVKPRSKGYTLATIFDLALIQAEN